MKKMMNSFGIDACSWRERSTIVLPLLSLFLNVSNSDHAFYLIQPNRIESITSSSPSPSSLSSTLMAIKTKLKQEICENPSMFQFGNGFDHGSMLPVALGICSQQQQQQQQVMMVLSPMNRQFQQQQQVLPGDFFSSALALELEKQNSEVEIFLRKQNENLLSVIRQHRKQQLTYMIKLAESKASTVLKKKEDELEKAKRRTMELTDTLTRSLIENQNWQRIAREHEALVFDLNNNLELAQQQNTNNITSSSSCGSCCCPSPKRTKKIEEDDGRRLCRGCRSEESNVLFFPCKHLCVCRSCASSFDSCPVCSSVKKCCIEVFVC